MGVAETISDWLPESPPTWDDVIVTVLQLPWLALAFSTLDSISWAALATGIGAVLVGAGPVANSSLGDRIDSHASAVGTIGRAAGIILFAIAVWVVVRVVHVPRTPVVSFSGGVVVALVVVVAFQALYAGKVSGWRITFFES